MPLGWNTYKEGISYKKLERLTFLREDITIPSFRSKSNSTTKHGGSFKSKNKISTFNRSSDGFSYPNLKKDPIIQFLFELFNIVGLHVRDIDWFFESIEQFAWVENMTRERFIKEYSINDRMKRWFGDDRKKELEQQRLPSSETNKIINKEWKEIVNKYKKIITREKLEDFWIKIRDGRKWVELSYPEDFMEFHTKYKIREPRPRNNPIDFEKMVQDKVNQGMGSGDAQSEAWNEFKELVKTLHPEDYIVVYSGVREKKHLERFKEEGFDLEIPPHPADLNYPEIYKGMNVRPIGIYVSPNKDTARRFSGISGGTVKFLIQAKHMIGRPFERADFFLDKYGEKEMLKYWNDPVEFFKAIDIYNKHLRSRTSVGSDIYLHTFNPDLLISLILMGSESQGVLIRPIWKDEFKKFEVGEVKKDGTMEKWY